MPQLIVSVRDACEAQVAVQAGADILDIKEPRRGSLGPADKSVVSAILKSVPVHVPVSVALGELRELNLDVPLQWQPRHPTFAKAGCAGLDTIAAWAAAFELLCGALPAEVEPVAVAYADHVQASAPAPEEILYQADQLGTKRFLIDTCHKSSGDMVSQIGTDGVASLVAQAHKYGMECALAGSIDRKGLQRLGFLEPDYIAVRGAVCGHGRESELCADRVRQFRDVVTRVWNRIPGTCR